MAAHLWRMNVPFPLREQVTALVRHHSYRSTWPSAKIPGLAIEVSQTARTDHLAFFRGRRPRPDLSGSQKLLDTSPFR